MISYGGIAIQIPAPEEAAWIEARIPLQDAFGFFRPKSLGDPSLNPRTHFNWFLGRPFKLNCYWNPWGASRWSYAFVIVDKKMHTAITAQNADGSALPFKMDDSLGSSITTDLFMLPPVPLSKINVNPSLPMFLLPLVDERYRWWERAASIEINEGVTTWANLYASIATGLDITLTVDLVSADYLKPGAGLARRFQPLPLLLDWASSSVGQRVVRRLNGTFAAINATTATSLMLAQTNSYRKYAGGTLSLGIVDG